MKKMKYESPELLLLRLAEHDLLDTSGDAVAEDVYNDEYGEDFS